MLKKADTPKITVIIPTYKRPQLLKRAIYSVLHQAFTDFKVCVYDNASSDETQAVVREIMEKDKRIVYHRHEKNIGAIKNFQYGLMRVDSPFFSFLSDDDFLLPNFLEAAMTGFVKYPEAVFSAGSVITMTDRGKILDEPFSLWEKEGLFQPPEGLLAALQEKYPIWTGILFRSEVIKFTHGLDEEIGGAGDLDFIHRISVKEPFVISKEPVAVCVNHATSLSAFPSISSYWPSWLKMIKNITEDEEVPQLVKNKFETALMEQIISVLLWIGIRSFEIRNFEQAEKAVKILTEELNQYKKAQGLAWLVNHGRKSWIFWRVAGAFIKLRRKIMSLVNIKRMKLQKKHGHLAERLQYE